MQIIHDKENHKFTYTENSLECYVRYEQHADTFDVVKTFVPKELGGRGIAATLVKEAYDYGKAQGYHLVATCSYALVFLERHPEYEGGKSEQYVEGACRL